MACICKIIIFLAGLLKMKPDNENLSHLTEKKQKRFLGTAISSTIKLLKSKKCRRKIQKREEEKEEKLKKVMLALFALYIGYFGDLKRKNHYKKSPYIILIVLTCYCEASKRNIQFAHQVVVDVMHLTVVSCLL